MSVAFSLSTDGQADTDPLKGTPGALPKPLHVGLPLPQFRLLAGPQVRPRTFASPVVVRT